FALEGMSTILWALSGSRLPQNLRERHSFTYGIVSGIVWRRAPEVSTFTSMSDVAAPKTDSALTLWIQELRDIGGARPPSGQEMDFAGMNRVAGLPRQLESIDVIADRVVTMAANDLPFTFYEEFISKMSALTAADVAAAAKKYVDAGKLAIVVVGDRKQIESA